MQHGPLTHGICMHIISAISSAVVSSALFLGSAAPGQTAGQPAEQPAATPIPELSVGSNLVLVPALVKTKSGEIVFSLTAGDFTLSDNGVPQRLRMESDIIAQPMAMVIIVQTGGSGAAHLNDYNNLGAVIDAVIGDVPHEVAVVNFDSAPHLAQTFSTNTDVATNTIANLQPGDPGAAILDALKTGIDLLRKQPPTYRRAVLLFSETLDSGSQTAFEDALKAIDDTNTAIYTFAFSSTKVDVKHQASKLPRPGGTPYSDTPYPKGGCMSRDPEADPDAHGKRDVQALDCASDLFPPLRLPRLVFLAARDGFRRNIPESVAHLTGGEYFAFKDAKTLSRNLVSIANDAPNYYVLSFHPQSPDPGLHALDVKLNDRPQLVLKVRNAYWVDAQAPK
jgi:VWFA-related protein